MESEGEPGALLGDSEAFSLDVLARLRVPQETVRVVQVHEKHPRGRRRRRSEPRDGFADERVRNVPDRPAGNLVRGKERPVDEREQTPFADEPFDGVIPLLPLVDVRQPEQLAPGSRHDVRDRVGVFVPVGDADRGCGERGRELELPARRHFADIDVLERDEPLPRAVLLQKSRHRRSAVDGKPLRPEHLAAELREAEVVPDVRMGEEDPVREAAERFDLGREVGRRVDDESAPRPAVDEAERSNAASRRRVLPGPDAERLAAAEVGHAAVLGDAEYDRFDARRGRGGAREGRRQGGLRHEKSPPCRQEQSPEGLHPVIVADCRHGICFVSTERRRTSWLEAFPVRRCARSVRWSFR